MFKLYMATSAKSNKIIQCIGFFIGIKAPKRFNVVNIKSLPQFLLADSAVLTTVFSFLPCFVSLCFPICSFIIRIATTFPQRASFHTGFQRAPFILAQFATKGFQIAFPFFKASSAKFAISNFFMRFNPTGFQVALPRAILAQQPTCPRMKQSATYGTLFVKDNSLTAHNSIIEQFILSVKDYCKMAIKRVEAISLPLL